MNAKAAPQAVAEVREVTHEALIAAWKNGHAVGLQEAALQAVVGEASDGTFSCAKRAADPDNEFAACRSHCGNDATCLRTPTAGEKAESDELRELILLIRKLLNSPGDSWSHKAAEAIMNIHPTYAALTPSPTPTAPQEADALREALSQAERDVLAERQRQFSKEGWTPEHDDEHDAGELAEAAWAYAAASAANGQFGEDLPPAGWPWEEGWWRPADPRRMLVKAGALILAEIERLDRAALAQHQPQQGEGA